MVPHKLPLRGPWRGAGGLRGLRALRGHVTQGVGSPPEALLRRGQGRLLRGLALRVTGQVVRRAEEPEGALGDGQGLLFTHRRLLAADRQQVRRIMGRLGDSPVSHSSLGTHQSLMRPHTAGKHRSMWAHLIRRPSRGHQKREGKRPCKCLLIGDKILVCGTWESAQVQI